MPEGDDRGYRAPARAGQAELREKGSRFLAYLEPVASLSQIEERLGALEQRHRDASHHCWAWRLGSPPRERSSDAGEPHGTAGMPILQSLRGADLSDVLVVVVRWFGGTKLGKGGLARAYGGAAREALAEVPTVERVPVTRLRLEVEYPALGGVERLVHPPGVEIEQSEYGERVALVLRVQRPQLATLQERLASLGVEWSQVESGEATGPE